MGVKLGILNELSNVLTKKDWKNEFFCIGLHVD